MATSVKKKITALKHQKEKLVSIWRKFASKYFSLNTYLRTLNASWKILMTHNFIFKNSSTIKISCILDSYNTLRYIISVTEMAQKIKQMGRINRLLFFLQPYPLFAFIGGRTFLSTSTLQEENNLSYFTW